MSLLFRPRDLLLQKVAFQVHLWIGITLGLYMLVIGASGAILVFQDELTPTPVMPKAPHSIATSSEELLTIYNQAQTAYPDSQFIGIELAERDGLNSTVVMKGQDGQYFTAIAQPAADRIVLRPTPFWLEWVGDLHIELLNGSAGRFFNGIGAGFLLLMCLSGAIIWWPGVKNWQRALSIRLKGSWKRINWDVHSAVGFWTLALLSMWAISGIYLVWPNQCSDVVNRFSSVSATLPPRFVVPARSRQPWPALDVMLTQAQQSSPKSQLSGVEFPRSTTAPLTVYMARGERGDFDHMDYVYLDPSTGKRLAIWHRGINPTLGSKLIFWLAPLHFGTEWGLPIKVIWAAAGLGLPLLFLTGALMYWNRTLSKKWRAIGKVSTVHAKAKKTELPVYVRTNDEGRLDPKINEVIHAETYEES